LGATPHFDCRVWQVPTLADAADVFVWREDDATKNSLTMAALAYYSESELSGRSSSQKHELSFQKGVNWNGYPSFFRRGTYVQRKTIERASSDDELARIPEKHRPPALTVERAEVREVALPPVRKIANLPEVLFDGAHYEACE
jgi:tRNA(His) guanylyltransferase